MRDRDLKRGRVGRERVGIEMVGNERLVSDLGANMGRERIINYNYPY